MPIVAADLLARLAATMANDDTSTTGGAIDTAAVAALVSDGADTRVVTIYGRLATGAIANEDVTLNGAVEVLSVNTYDRCLQVPIPSTSGTRTVTGKQGAGGTTRITFPPNTSKARCFFYNAISAAAPQTRYEKMFWLDNHGALALLDAPVTLPADPQADITIALSTSVNDSVTTANRKTEPGSIGAWTDDAVAINVPGTNLAAGAKIGTWIRQSLAGGNAAYKDSFTTQLSGG